MLIITAAATAMKMAAAKKYVILSFKSMLFPSKREQHCDSGEPGDQPLDHVEVGFICERRANGVTRGEAQDQFENRDHAWSSTRLGWHLSSGLRPSPYHVPHHHKHS